MKKIFFAVLFCFMFSVSPYASETPTEDSLIKTWENIQKNDPNTVTFEKINDRHYKLSNKHFPFDGELKIKDVTIDSTIMVGNSDNFIMGIIDVEFEKMPKDFIQQHSRKYYMWAMNNNLYYDKKAGKWLSSKEFQTAMMKMQKEMSRPSLLSSFFSDYFLIIALLIVSVFLIYFTRHYKRTVKNSFQRQDEAITRVNKSIELSERGIMLGEETNKILKDILSTLKDKKL
jgi:hypothetical protein